MNTDEIVIRFVFRKGAGNSRPQRSELSDSEARDFRQCITMNLCWEPFLISDQHPGVLITSMEVLYDGCTRIEGESFGLYFDQEELLGYPAPIIRFRLNTSIDVTAFTRAIRETDIEITTSSLEASGESPYYAEDHNGYTSALDEEQEDAWVELLHRTGVFSGYKETFHDGLVESGYPIAGTNYIIRPMRAAG